jgi:hypothetical protein
MAPTMAAPGPRAQPRANETCGRDGGKDDLRESNPVVARERHVCTLLVRLMGVDDAPI